MAHVATVSTVQRTVIPASVVKNYQPEKASPTLTVLKLGVQDPAVSLLQGFLLNRGYNPGSIDGHFGKMTENAVKSLQQDSFGELKVDGVAGPQTLKYIESLPLVTNSHMAAGNTNTNTNVSSTNTEPTKVKIPSLPNKVLAKVLTAPSLVPISETNAVSALTKIPALLKPLRVASFGFAVILFAAETALVSLIGTKEGAVSTFAKTLFGREGIFTFVGSVLVEETLVLVFVLPAAM
jgi:hypothetical protein